MLSTKVTDMLWRRRRDLMEQDAPLCDFIAFLTPYEIAQLKAEHGEVARDDTIVEFAGLKIERYEHA